MAGPEAGERTAGGARRRRRGGRGAGPKRAVAGATPGVQRRIPPYALLDERDLARVEVEADRLLAEVGVEFGNDAEALELWRAAGANVDGARVRLEPGLTRELIQNTAPARFVQHARNPERSIEIGGDRVVFSPTYGPPFVRDLAGERRYAALADFEAFVKLAYLSPWLHHSGGTVCEPVDVPVNKRHLDMVYAHVSYSDKPFMGSITTPDRAAESIDLARIVFGPDFVADNCVIIGNFNVNSPLVFDVTVTETMKVYARANQAVTVVPFILGGAMGPVTTSGALAQALAEAMAGAAFIQLVRPGAPVIMGNFLSSMSLRSGAPTFGMPEPALAYVAIGQLARRLGLPLRAGGALTSSKLPDGQAMLESADSLLPTVLGGANFVMHAAGWLEGGLVMSYEKFLMDADHLGMMHRLLQGLALDDNAFAQDAFREVGPGHHFLGCRHTMANYTDAFYIPELADADSYEQWLEKGGLDARERANLRCRTLLSEYAAPALDPKLDAALREYIRERKQARPDAWY